MTSQILEQIKKRFTLGKPKKSIKLNRKPIAHSGFEPPYEPHKWMQHNALESHNCYSYMLNDLYARERPANKPQPGTFASKTQKDIENIISKINRVQCSVKRAVLHDNSVIRMIPLSKGESYECKPHHYKGFLMISPGRDYHFARQDNRMIFVYRKLSSLKFPKQKTKVISLINQTIDSEIPEIVKLANLTIGKNHSSTDRIKKIMNFAKVWSHKPGSTQVSDKDANNNLILNPSESNWDFSSSPNGGINYSINCAYFEIPTNYYKHTKSTGVMSNTVLDPKKIRRDLSATPQDRQFENLIQMLIAKKQSASNLVKSKKFLLKLQKT
tara:strand:- start:2879 stop:3859 length:981 start_codon:yes stop_codon:yes gene_type:complete